MLFNPGTLIEALLLFRRLRPRVVHTHNLLALSPSIWLAARLAGARVVHTHHDLWLLCERSTMTRRDGRYCEERTAACMACRAARPIKRAQLRLVAREIFPSLWLRDRLQRSGAIVRPFARTGIRAAAPPDEATLLYLGRLVPSKGIETLLAAFESVRTTVPARLVVAGFGPLEPLVRRAAGVVYAGEVVETRRDELISTAAAVVLPSLGPDASPTVAHEALAAGVPVVVSDTGGLSELGELGAVVVPPDDEAALANALVEVVSTPRRLQPASELASPERFRRELEDVLRTPAAEEAAARRAASAG